MNEHWTEIETEALKGINSFDEMVPIAITVLKRMAALGKPIHQVCGPISTGGRRSVSANSAYFQKAIKVAQEQGLTVFDQFPFQAKMSELSAGHDERQEYCTDILHIFYRGIFASGYISTLLFLPGWQTSTGATWEWNEARVHNLDTQDYPKEWLPLLE